MRLAPKTPTETLRNAHRTLASTLTSASAAAVVVRGDVEVLPLRLDGHVPAASRLVRVPAAVEQRGGREVVALGLLEGRPAAEVQGPRTGRALGPRWLSARSARCRAVRARRSGGGCGAALLF